MCPYGARHGLPAEHDRGDDEGLFIVRVFVLMFEQRDNRSSDDTGRLAPEPPIYPKYANVYIVLKIYDSSIKYYTTIILMYGTRMYTKTRQFILLSLYSVYIIYIIYIYILYSTKRT